MDDHFGSLRCGRFRFRTLLVVVSEIRSVFSYPPRSRRALSGSGMPKGELRRCGSLHAPTPSAVRSCGYALRSARMDASFAMTTILI
jgi:hypothetical protein